MQIYQSHVDMHVRKKEGSPYLVTSAMENARDLRSFASKHGSGDGCAPILGVA